MSQINIAGLIYNHCLALHRIYHRMFSKHIQVYQLMKHLTKLKHTKPKFKAVWRYKSFTLKQAGWKLDEVHGKIHIGKRWYRYFKSRMIEGKVKTVTVKRDAAGDIYIYLVCDSQLEQVRLRTGKSVGFGRLHAVRHFGLKQFLTGSNGHDIVSPNFFMQNIKTIRKKCRKLSRRQKGSHNRHRYRKELARAYRRMDNQRKDFHFKTARKLCEEYACICLETLLWNSEHK